MMLYDGSASAAFLLGLLMPIPPATFYISCSFLLSFLSGFLFWAKTLCVASEKWIFFLHGESSLSIHLSLCLLNCLLLSPQTDMRIWGGRGKIFWGPPRNFQVHSHSTDIFFSRTFFTFLQKNSPHKIWPCHFCLPKKVTRANFFSSLSFPAEKK